MKKGKRNTFETECLKRKTTFLERTQNKQITRSEELKSEELGSDLLKIGIILENTKESSEIKDPVLHFKHQYTQGTYLN